MGKGIRRPRGKAPARHPGAQQEWFDRAMQEAGFASVDAVAKAIGSSSRTVWRIRNGSTRPAWQTLEAVSDALRIPVDEVVERCWNEMLSCACPCPEDCGGVTVVPQRAEARVLSIERQCRGCGEVTTYTSMWGHSPTCGTCSLGERARSTRVLLRCRACGTDSVRRGAQVRWEIKNNPDSGIVSVNWETMRGEQHQCGRCSSSAAMRVALRRLTRRRGRVALVEQGRRLAAGQTDEQRRASLVLARAARLGRAASEKERRNNARGHLATRLKGRFGRCRISGCGLLTYTAPAHLEHGHAGETHKKCLDAEKRRLKAGPTYYPSRGRGARWSSDSLMDSYEMVVRHIVRGEKIESLATAFSLEPRAVQYRIRGFLELLPTDDRGGKWLQRRARLLRD